MIFNLKIKTIFTITLVFIISLSTIQIRSVEKQIQANSIPDVMPNAIRVLLDNPKLCNERNDQRDKNNQLDCRESNFALDPDTYTMDQYVTGVLRSEVGPVPAITNWDIERKLKSHQKFLGGFYIYFKTIICLIVFIYILSRISGK